MNNTKLQHYYLMILLILVAILTFFILRPFIYIIILSFVCAIVFWPVREKINHLLHNKPGLAALFTTIIIIVVILFPLIFLGIQVFQETQDLYSFLINNDAKGIVMNAVNNLATNFQTYFPSQQKFSLNIDADQYIQRGALWSLNHLDNIFGSITKLLFNFFIFIIITYCTLLDGHKLKTFILKLSPLKDDNDETIFEKIKIAMNSVVKGSVLIALMQGVLATIGFAIFGVPNFVLWGSVATIAAFIPGIGTALVVIPAVIFIFITKGAFSALGLLAWGMIVVGLIDNILRPMFIGKGIKIHPLVIFLSVLGGIVFFGPIGVLLGPLTISLTFAILDLYFSLLKSESNNSGFL